MGLVNGRGRFSTLHSSETPRPIFIKLEISRTRTRMQNFRGLCRRGWSGQIASLTHEIYTYTTLSKPVHSPGMIKHTFSKIAVHKVREWQRQNFFFYGEGAKSVSFLFPPSIKSS